MLIRGCSVGILVKPSTFSVLVGHQFFTSRINLHCLSFLAAVGFHSTKASTYFPHSPRHRRFHITMATFSGLLLSFLRLRWPSPRTTAGRSKVGSGRGRTNVEQNVFPSLVLLKLLQERFRVEFQKLERLAAVKGFRLRPRCRRGLRSHRRLCGLSVGPVGRLAAAAAGPGLPRGGCPGCRRVRRH